MSKHSLPRSDAEQQKRRKRIVMSGLAAILTIGVLGGGLGGLNASWSNRAVATTDVEAAASMTINGVEAFDMNSDLDPLVPGETQTVPLSVRQVGPGDIYAAVEYNPAQAMPGLAENVTYRLTDRFGNVVFDDTLDQLTSPVFFPQGISGAGPQAWNLQVTLDPNAPEALAGGVVSGVDLVLTAQ